MICYAAPTLMANISADPDNPAAEQWWAAKAAEIKSLFPTFGGVLVKADCEGNDGCVVRSHPPHSVTRSTLYVAVFYESQGS